MELTFLGHQTWLVSHDSSTVLIDPILEDGFGAEDINGIEIFPPRTVDLESMPKPDAIILTHEHSDHFNIPSINALSRDTKIIVGTMMIESVVECLENLGFSVIRQLPNTSFQLGNLEFTLYSAAPDTVLWESRVHQIYVHPVNKAEDSIFIAVDALISEKFQADISNEYKAVPLLVALSNNAQITPKGVFGSLDNLLFDYDSSDKTGVIGLDILYELLIDYLAQMPQIENILICGNGFMKDYDNLGAFPFSDQKKLAAIAQKLSRNVNVFGPYPGDSYFLSNGVLQEQTVSWIQLRKDRFKKLLSQQAHFINSKKVIEIRSICGNFASKVEANQADKTIENEMSKLAMPLMLSDLGERAVEMVEYLDEKLDSKRILFQFLNSDRTCRYQWALDLNKASFVKDITPTNQILRRFPFGLVCFARDFYQMLLGEIQIWDMAGVAMRSWYVSNKLQSPVAFLYCYYGEQVQYSKTKLFYQKFVEQQ